MTDEVGKFYKSHDKRFETAIIELARVIENNDLQIDLKIGKMMRSDAILYCQKDIMKYAITCHTKHISLHLMPIYCYADIHEKHKKLITSGKFQKGCINFAKLDELPVEQIGHLINECAQMPYPTQYQLDKR